MHLFTLVFMGMGFLLSCIQGGIFNNNASHSIGNSPTRRDPIKERKFNFCLRSKT